jgi:hypothetical protein
MLKFSRNMSLADRSIRIMVGTTLFLIGPLTNLVETDTTSNILLGVVGAIALISGASAYCFLYDITGFNTRRE